MESVERYCYPAVFSQAFGEDIAVVFPDLDAATSGENNEDALSSARDLLGCVLRGLVQDGAAIPEPTRLEDIPLAEGERAVLVEADLPTVRMAREKSSRE